METEAGEGVADEELGRARRRGQRPAREPVLLKQSLKRSVRLVEAEGGRRQVVKRFHGASEPPRGARRLPGMGAIPGLGALRSAHDAARARNELELLSHLHASGAPVPRPLELRRGAGGGHEVVMEWVPDSVTLLEVLAGEAPYPVAPPELTRRAARLLAALEARGLDHPDLHAGNVLVDPRGELVAIDFHRARLVDRLDAGALESHLVQSCAGSREFVSRSERRRFLSEWFRALPARLARQLGPAPDLRALARRVEDRGRELRRATVLRRQARWTREGTAVAPLAPELWPGSRGWIRAGADPARLAALLRSPSAPESTPEAPRHRSGLRGWRASDRVGGAPPADLLLARPRVPELLAIWLASARLFEHRIPCAAPLAVSTGPRPWLALELPAGARPANADELPSARARLLEALADRGLRAELAEEHVWVAPGASPAASDRALLVSTEALELA